MANNILIAIYIATITNIVIAIFLIAIYHVAIFSWINLLVLSLSLPVLSKKFTLIKLIGFSIAWLNIIDSIEKFPPIIAPIIDAAVYNVTNNNILGNQNSIPTIPSNAPVISFNIVGFPNPSSSSSASSSSSSIFSSVTPLSFPSELTILGFTFEFSNIFLVFEISSFVVSTVV